MVRVMTAMPAMMVVLLVGSVMEKLRNITHSLEALRFCIVKDKIYIYMEEKFNR